MVPFDDVEEECIDKSPYCTANDCKVRPGYALVYCKKTCGNCEPFCYDSQIISCKESRKRECDSMLKDYCPLLCGVCRAKKKKLKKTKGARLMFTPVSAAKFEVLQKFSSSKSSKPDTSAISTTTRVPIIIPAVVRSSSFSDGPSTSTPIFRSSTEDGDSNPLPFLDTSSAESSPILVEEDDKEGLHPAFGEHVERLPDSDVEAMDNGFSAPESVRIVLKPPWPRREPQEHFSKFPHSLDRSSIPILPTEASRFHPSLPPPRWLFPHQEETQSYLASHSAFFPNRYSQNVYGQFGSGLHLESSEDAPVNLGELIALLGLQCLDSIKIDCNKVRRLGGCRLPIAGEYCSKTCRLCALPARIAESLPPCKDELDTCENLAESGVCDHPYSKKALRTYCAKSCGHCRESQYYMNDAYYRRMPRKKQRKPPKMPLG
ncbi:unnamed protein product [Cylicocyclus nassatus]|uniref:ShKT domain-containing protein n=1 Tax=Cylicocyclus nassatus TaxID=53992 RepID=A0AA36M6W5_CYLNA|nr:unnamed protein product [Cylicocyclus nassatus]